jgi:hypothetical protein
MFKKTPENLPTTNPAGQELLEAFGRLRQADLELAGQEHHRCDPLYWRAERNVLDILFDMRESRQGVTIVRHPGAPETAITRVKTVGEKILGNVEQVSGYVSSDQAAFFGRLVVHRELPQIPFYSDDENPFFNLNFRRQYRVEPFMAESGEEALLPAVDIAVI